MNPAWCATHLDPGDREEFEQEMNAQELIDAIEQDIQRMRIDGALKAHLVARLDELRALVK